jgi:predicted phage terminase large subunit-like protein
LTKNCAQCDKTWARPAWQAYKYWEIARFCSRACKQAYDKTDHGRLERSAQTKAAQEAGHDKSAPSMQELALPSELAQGVIIPNQAPNRGSDTTPPDMGPALREMAQRVLARRSLLQFTKKTHPSYEAGWVHADICKRLERFSADVAARKSPRLMLLMPPRHGKSELASIRFPAWHLGHHPDHEVINVGYNLDLPMKFSRKVREMFRDNLYTAIFAGAKLDPDSQSIEAWNTTQGGGFTAAGVGGGITGKGAHVLIVDDPLKNMEEADSAQTREKLWDWYLSTAYTRLAPGGGVLVIETWWNDDDLAGRLQAAMRADPLSDQFVVVKYPALAEKYEFRHKETLHIVRTDEPALSREKLVGEAVAAKLVHGDSTDVSLLEPQNYELLRSPGEALHTARYDATALGRIKANQAPRIWSALYQQNPVPDEGLYFRKDYVRLVPVTPQPYGLNIFTAWDFAIGEKQANDYTVGATLVQDHMDNLYVVEINRFKGDSFTIVEEILNVYERWGVSLGADYLLGFEDGQIFRAIKPLLEKRMLERTLYPSYEILRPLTDKMARARSLQGRMQQGRVYFPEDAPWLSDTTHELLRFPGGVHDDIVDALAWAVNLVVGKSPPQKNPPQTLVSWKDRIDELMVGYEGSHMAA